MIFCHRLAPQREAGLRHNGVTAHRTYYGNTQSPFAPQSNIPQNNHARPSTSPTPTPPDAVAPMRPGLRLFAISSASKPVSSRLRNKPPPPSLEHFVQRQRVLSLWRSILRSLYKIPKDRRSETVTYARNEFERNKTVQDIAHIRYLLSTGKTEFDAMRRYIDELAAR